MSINRPLLETACRALNIFALTDEEYSFIDEYRNCVKPVADALKCLEGQNHSFGLYLPVLYGLKMALNDLRSNFDQYCLPLIEAIEVGFTKRFDDLMNVCNPKSIPLYLAMVANPRYKLDYLRMDRIPAHIYNNVFKYLFNECKQIYLENRNSNDHLQQEQQEPDSQTQVQAREHVDVAGPSTGRFSTFLIPNDVRRSGSFAPINESYAEFRAEIERYLRAPTSDDIIGHLNEYPLIRQVYLKYSCIRTSEAICERMFSFAGKLFELFFVSLYAVLTLGLVFGIGIYIYPGSKF